MVAFLRGKLCFGRKHPRCHLEVQHQSCQDHQQHQHRRRHPDSRSVQRRACIASSVPACQAAYQAAKRQPRSGTPALSAPPVASHSHRISRRTATLTPPAGVRSPVTTLLICMKVIFSCSPVAMAPSPASQVAAPR